MNKIRGAFRVHAYNEADIVEKVNMWFSFLCFWQVKTAAVNVTLQDHGCVTDR